MNYLQTIKYLYTKLPVFANVGVSAIKKNLTNTLALCEVLNNPHLKFKSIHVAGTNGKGSTSHMLAAILQKAGYKVGLYTSPHLKDFRERIRINGKMITKREVINFVKIQKSTIEIIKPSFFEVTVAMAFNYFAQSKVDIAVVEVGLGGRLDSTNIITPKLSVITNISIDHTNLLGNTLEEIANEKAGIIKKNIPVVIGEIHPKTQSVFIKTAKAEKSPISFACNDLQIKHVEIKNDVFIFNIHSSDGLLKYRQLKLDLTGTYQLKNILTVLKSIETLNTMGFNISQKAIARGLLNVKKTTGLMGRWQTLGKNPLIICDTGHNLSGITEVVANICKTAFNKLHMVMGFVKDKDVTGILNLLPKNADYYFCQPPLERALDVYQLEKQARACQLNGSIYPTVQEAFLSAKKLAKANDMIFVGGSTFVVAQVI